MVNSPKNSPHEAAARRLTRVSFGPGPTITSAKTGINKMESAPTMKSAVRIDSSETQLRDAISTVFGGATGGGPRTQYFDSKSTEASQDAGDGTYETFDERWQKGKRAALALERMLDQPPDLKTLTLVTRIKELRELTESPIFKNRFKGWIGLIVRHPAFDYVMGIIIMLNAIAIGVEQTLSLEKKELSVTEIAEHVFLIIYVIELAMNLAEEGTQTFYESRWLQLDAALVVIGIASTWIITPIVGHIDGLGALFVLRIVRLLRLARMVRLMRYKELWTLVRGFTNSAATMCYTSMLLFMVMYGFACVAVELITNNPAYGKSGRFTEVVDDYFCNLPRIMLTLLQFICMDSVSPIYTPLVVEDGYLIIYFFAVILSVAVVLMNIVTAVIVNAALETASLDKEAKRAYTAQIRKGITEELGRMFEFFDEDHAGTVTMKELLEAPPEAITLLCKLTEHDKVEDIFVEIDVNGDGELTLEEFCQGVLDIVISEVPHEIRQMQTKMQMDFMRVFEILERIEGKLDKGFARLAAVETVAHQSASFSPYGIEITTPQTPDTPNHNATFQNYSISPALRATRCHKPPRKDEKQDLDVLPDVVPPWAVDLLRELRDTAKGGSFLGRDCPLTVTSSARLAPSYDVRTTRQPAQNGQGAFRMSESELSPLLASANEQSDCSLAKEEPADHDNSKPHKKKGKVVKRVARNAKPSLESSGLASELSKSPTLDEFTEVQPQPVQSLLLQPGKVQPQSLGAGKYDNLFEEDDD